ncbi:hypothetical protein B0I35DRAFT_409666 [Stachybotrys elegans]|uniref:DUF7728 domain-containing protein n=1 Tax=Stachybotrys elegans TaxID=80388 RepID=A0A8K0WPH3_9HYPO|nr:hypothetical protein B0I35DRAFT_409666 [Stachybotrys elegans]
MLFKPLLFAATAAAFLITGDLPPADEGAFRILPVEADAVQLPPTAFAHTLQLPCRQCRGQRTSMEMNLAIEDGNRFTLNGLELYPTPDPLHDLNASVMRAHKKTKWQRLGYSLAITKLGKDDQQHLEVLGVQLEIVEVGNHFVKGVPVLDIKLIQAPNGELLMGNVAILENDASKCDTTLCRLRKMFENSRGCKGFRGQQSGSHHRHDGHRHGHHGNFGELVRQIATHLFLPALMGLMAGVLVACLATVLCTSIIHLARWVRGGRREQPWHATDNAQVEEKAALMEQYADEKN